MSKISLRLLLSLAAIFSCLSSTMAQAATASTANNKLMIVNGNNGHVIYDDGQEDMYCVTRRHIIGYDRYGHRIRARSMRCR